MKHTIRYFILFFTLFIGSVGNAWAISESDIIINIQPNNAAGTVSVTGISEMTVTISATPAAGYSIDATHIIAEKMVNPLKAPRRATGIASKLDITDNGSNSFSFTIPAGYDGAYVTVNFFKDTPNGITSLDQITDLAGTYVLTADVDASGFNGKGEFTGTLDGGLHKVYNLSKPLFSSTNGAIIRNIIFEDVNISSGDGDGDAGAVTSKAKGATRIYNCGILPTSVERDDKGNITGFYGSSVGATRNVGGIVGFLDGSARVINCYSYANITGGTNVAGIVGNNNYASKMNDVRTMVVNCMFYGEITGTTIKPVYGGKSISNKGTTGINNYNYFRGSAAFNTETTFSSSDAYYCSWPASEEYLTRFEYYRSILNSNRQLCTWWVNGTSGTTPTDEDVNNVGIAKWVLDPSIAPYPILKEWGKYPSVINQDKEYTYNPDTKQKVSRASAPAYQGKKLGTLSVTVKAGSGHQGSGSTSEYLNCIVLDMDTLNYDYGYAKIQLPYYNEVFGNPEAIDHANRYAGNYTDKAVTGWKVTNVIGGTSGTFKKAWEDGYNFADRKCTSKDLYDTSGRVFAQGGYYYVPEGVTSITIEAYWANKVIYLHNNEHSLDRVNVASGGTTAGAGTSFSPAGTLPTFFQEKTVYTTLQDAIAQLTASASLTVYDQAIVLVGNVQVKNLSASVGHTGGAANNKPFTIMSIDQDLDNEPDYCLELQFRSGTDRPTIHPIRFDFLPIPELGLAIKTDSKAYAIGIMVPLGHFEITETAFMHTTQFEYDGVNRNAEGPMILNGGQFEQIVIRYGTKNHTNYFIMGGNFRMSRFTPGYHATPDNNGTVRHCAVNAIGGDFPEFYLSGIYNPDKPVNEDNPHCYINGGRFGTIAGAGYEQVNGNVTFQIDHAVIDVFYGGGMNSAKPVTGSIDVTINNSIVHDKYCGGPMVGEMTKTDGVRKTVTTNATNTIFGQYFGGGNGGTSYYREQSYDSDIAWPSSWTSSTFKFTAFNPLNTASISQKYDAAKGYHDMFEYEVFNQSNGVNDNVVARTFTRWAQFGTTITGTVTNNLTNCTIDKNFYGGGNLGTVDGNVISTLDNTVIGGSAFGAGYSAAIPQFRRHDRTKVHAPARNKSGQIVDYGYLEYYQDGGKDVYYRWTNDTNNGTATTDAPTYYSEADGEWKCYTPISLEGLGAVSGKATLTINGTTTVAESVYGGGEESCVGGDTEVTVNSGTIGAEGRSSYGYRYGNVYGGGKGKIDNEGNLVVSSVADLDAGLVKGNTSVTINGTKETTKIVHNVYGGGAVGSVGTFNRDANGNPTECTSGGQATVTINGGQVGHNRKDSGMVNGSSRGWEGNPNGEGAFAFLNQLAWVNNGTVIIGDATTNDEDKGPVIMGSVYGGGENGHNYSDGSVTINKGTIGNAASSAESYDCGNVYGAGCGTDTYTIGEDPTEHHNQKAGWVRGNTNVTVNGGNILRNVYGAGSMGSVGNDTNAESGKTTININGGTIGRTEDSDHGHVFGGPKGNLTETEFKASVMSTLVNINAHPSDAAKNPIVWGSVFGGGEAGIIKGSVVVNMNGGTVKKDVYGGGALADTQTSNWDATANENAGGWADAEKKSALHTTTVRLTGGRVGEEVFGGGLGEAGKPAYVWGDVLVDLNGTTPIDGTTYKPSSTGAVTPNATGCAVGQIFGCNNINGTPKGDVMVHVYATQNAAATQIVNSGEVTNAKVKGHYDVTAVYGGGNQAAYNPVTPYDGTSGSKTQVLIEGCSLTSIETVYGGGNAAAVPETNVDIKGAYEIGYLFGGGNGKDDIAPGVENPGADVGTLDHGTSTYGTGNANTLMEGGLIHEAYGGSNTRGTIKGSINQTTNPKASTDPGYCCDLEVEKIVGAGKYADIDGDVNMDLSCQPSKKVDLLFAGADEANVNGNITLNITNGHFGKVFGGNNLGGAIKGKITVNVEETGCQPIKIDDLYLGSNEAPYSVFGYYESDEIHSVTGKNILKPRESATDPRKPVKYDGTEYASISDFTNYDQPELNIFSCTYIGNVFGGGFGKGAVMYANPTVNVNMEPGNHAATAVPAMMTELGLDVTKTAPNPDKLGIIRNIYGGGDEANIAGDTHVNIATEPNKGAYIIGSVFGGGNAADVLGNTNVTMSGGYVFNGIFGGGYAGSVGTFTRSTAAADVNIYGHTTHEGCIGKPTACAEGTGKCTVVVDGGQIGPLSVATQGMNRAASEGGPVAEGWVWGAGQGLVEDPAEHPDTHFTSYVGETDVTIGGTALVMESIIGGGEFGRVLGNTLVKIEGGQIGIGEGMKDNNNKPIRYTDDQFVNPITTTITDANALTECSHYPYGRNIGTTENPNWVYLPYDPYCEKYPDYFAAHPEFAPASTSNPSDGKTWIGCVFAGGSGYMPYEKKDGTGYDWCPSAGLVEGDAEVRISGGHILTNVYGGNEITDVKGKSIVKMTGGTIGVPRTLEQIVKHPLTCYLFGAGKGDERSRFYNYTNTGSVEVEISGGIIYGSVFGGSEDGHVTGNIKMDIKPGAIIGTYGTSYVDGNVFGGGRGFSGNTLTAGNVGGNVTLNISGGNILGSIYGGGRLASVGTYLVETTDANYGEQIPDVGNDKHGHITINISGGTIGNDKEYIYNPTAEQKAAIPNTTFDYQNHLQYAKGGNVFTGGMGRLYALDGKTVLSSWQKLGQCKQTVLNMTGGTVKSSVYGGGEIGIVAQSATVNINGGTVGTKIVNPGDATQYYNFGSVFGGGKGSTDNIDGISMAGTTQGDVEVHLNKTPSTKGAIVNQVFGCNDMNGSPKGTVTVHVYATQSPDKDNISTKPAKGTKTFDVEAVYGGGNLAAYEPEGGKNTTKSTKVIVDGCGLTSIRQVYGGGNAASTPATNVTVNGTYEVLELFGGGNGFDKLPDGRPNPGANVGYKNYTVYEQDSEDNWIAKDDPAYDTKEERTAGNSAITYGTGQASINVFGGTIHRVFGGSNTKGNVRQTAVTLLDENSECEFCVDEAYGGGKSAPMDAEAKLLMACIPGLNAVYGGAEAAAIQGNVTLNITNGTFDRVFGGNNLSGTINGSITVNIEEIGCRPIKIGELYGGGNQAGYSVYGYNADGTPKESGTKIYEDPQVNVKSFTSIGKVFGGGYGSGATMVGNPTVNVNEVYGKWYNDDTSVVGDNEETPNHYAIPSHAKGKMGAISEVFGGGNAAKVIGSTTVNIATQEEVYLVKQVSVGDALTGLYTRSGAGTTASPYVYTAASGTAEEHVTYYEKRVVLGADVRGNVYGGGNNAEVTGATNVTIGKPEP